MGFPINPPNTPLVDAKGLPTAAFYRFLLNIQKVVGSSDVGSLDDTTFLAMMMSGVEEPGTLTPGTGLSGGGNMGANVDLALDTTSSRNVDHSAVSITAGAGMSGGGTIDATRTLAIANTAVTPGTYSPPASITVNSRGQITAIS